MTRIEVCRFLGHHLRYRFVGPLTFMWCDDCRAMR